MSILKKLRQKFHFFLLKRKISKSNNSHKTIGLDEARSIGVLFEAGDNNDVEKILSLSKEFKSRNKEVQLLGYIPYKLNDYNPPYPYFTKKSVNWLYFANSEQTEQFIQKRFDILCCLFTKENLTLEAIAALSNASFRVGKYSKEKTHCYDFMVNTKKEAPVRLLLQEINHFLTQIRTDNVSAI